MTSQPFTMWPEPGVPWVVQCGAESGGELEACDPYRLMVEAGSARFRREDAWVLPLATSEAIVAPLDAVGGAPAVER